MPVTTQLLSSLCVQDTPCALSLRSPDAFPCPLRVRSLQPGRTLVADQVVSLASFAPGAAPTPILLT